MGFAYKRGDTWTAAWRVDGKQKTKGGFKTKKLATQYWSEMEYKISTGEYVDGVNFTLDNYMIRWLRDYAKINLTPKAYKRYSDIVRLHVSKIGHIHLAKLKPTHIQSLYTKMSEKFSPGSVLYVHRVLSEALKHAVKWQLLVRNPADSVEPPAQKKPITNTLTFDQCLILFEHKGTLQMPVLLAATTGLRLSELCGVRWSDIDLNTGVLTLMGTLQRVDGKLQFVESSPTNKNHRRRIKLMSFVVNELKSEHARQSAIKLLCKKDKDYHDTDFVCRWDDGRPISPDYVSHKFPPLLDKLGLPKVRFHDLRHSHATHLLESGIHPKIVAERLGHSSIRVTMDTYSHVMPHLQDTAMNELEQRFKKPK